MTDRQNIAIGNLKNALWIFLVVAMAACSPANLRVIKNPEMNNWDGKQGIYQNLHPPRYGYLEETEYDRIDFLEPHERRPHKYKIQILTETWVMIPWYFRSRRILN
jgi:hypothetical protein